MGVRTNADPIDLYLNLLSRTLTRTAFPERFRPFNPRIPWKRSIAGVAHAVLDRAGLKLVRRAPDDAAAPRRGRNWPMEAETMISLARLDNVRSCIERVLDDDVPGDLIETGVWRGGATIFMRAVLAAHGVEDRVVWVADSFAGLPPPSDRYPADEGDTHHTYRELAVPLDEVRANFERYGLLDEQVRFLPGWFQDTLPSAPIERLSILRLDGDMYGSTIVALEALEPRVSPGGFVIVDDYALKGARRAVEDYRERSRITAPLVPLDGMAAYWRKQDET